MPDSKQVQSAVIISYFEVLDVCLGCVQCPPPRLSRPSPPYQYLLRRNVTYFVCGVVTLCGHMLDLNKVLAIQCNNYSNCPCVEVNLPSAYCDTVLYTSKYNYNVYYVIVLVVIMYIMS